MKTANISIDTAKAMYAQGGAAKKFALDNFTEQELTKKALPKTWIEAAIGKDGYFVSSQSKVYRAVIEDQDDVNCWPTSELAEANKALSQLAVLRKAYRDSYKDGWEPDWADTNRKHCIHFIAMKIVKNDFTHGQEFLSFPTSELRDEFLSNFEALILKAQPLL